MLISISFVDGVLLLNVFTFIPNQPKLSINHTYIVSRQVNSTTALVHGRLDTRSLVCFQATPFPTNSPGIAGIWNSIYRK
jgi:hypothetical protein